MTIEQEIKLQVEARTKERLNEKTIETAKKMIAANLGTVEQIASVTGLSLEQVTKLKTGEN